MKIMLIISLLLAAQIFCQDKKLIFVQEVFRHGARYPIYPNNQDGSSYASQQGNAGELTYQGKSMHYSLGRQLYKSYWRKLFPLSSQYHQSKFYVKSTNVNRTIESVQSQLLGIFQNTINLTINSNDIDYIRPQWNVSDYPRQNDYVYQRAPSFHSIPIHVEKGYLSPWDKGDFLRTYSSQFCPKQVDWQNQNLNNFQVTKMMNYPKFTQAIDILSEQLGKNITFTDVFKYFDNAECMIYQRKTSKLLQIWTRPQDDPVIRAINAIYTMDLYIKLFYTEQQLRTTSTGFFQQTLKNMKNIINNKQGVKWVLYSAHDTTVANFIARLGLTSAKCIFQNYLNGTFKNKQSQYCIVEYPIYTSNLIFQLYQSNDGKYYVVAQYNGYPRRLPFCDYAYECSFERFESWIQSWQDNNYVQSCGVKDSKGNTYFSIMVLQFGVILAFIIYFFVSDEKKDKIIQKPKPKINEVINVQAQNRQTLLTED